MKNIRTTVGGLGNLMFKEAFITGKLLDGEIPDLYVQSEKYWKKHANVIKERFSEGIGHTDAISLHIRRGDYIDNPFYVNLWETDYYKKAVALFPNEKFLVFCRDNQGWEQDRADRQWCRDNLPALLGDNWELPPKDISETDELNLMASCKGHIGANSSFSWWGSYLGEGKKVMPKEWFSDGVERTECPEDWIKI